DPNSGAAFSGAPSSIGNPLLFTGRRYDVELGWYYSRVRYLDPRSGCFSQREWRGPWGDPMSLGNSYGYAAARPTTMVDPYGTEPQGPAPKEDPLAKFDKEFQEILRRKFEIHRIAEEKRTGKPS